MNKSAKEQKHDSRHRFGKKAESMRHISYPVKANQTQDELSPPGPPKRLTQTSVRRAHPEKKWG